MATKDGDRGDVFVMGAAGERPRKDASHPEKPADKGALKASDGPVLPRPSAVDRGSDEPSTSGLAPIRPREGGIDKRPASRMPLDPDKMPDIGRRLHLREVTETPADKPRKKPAPDKVGEELREARLAAGLELRAVSDALRIRYKYLEALEQGQYEDLPGHTYAVGFVRAYAEHLRLDPEDLVRRFKAELGDPAPAVPLAQSPSELGFPAARDEARLPTGLTMILLLLLLIGGGVGWYFSRSPVPTTAEVVPEPPVFQEPDATLLRPPPSVPVVGEPGPETGRTAAETAAGLETWGQVAPASPGDVETASGGVGGEPGDPTAVAAAEAVGGAEAGSAALDGAQAANEPEEPFDLGLEPRPMVVDGVGAGVAGTGLDAKPTRTIIPGKLDRVEILALRRAWLRIEDASGNVVVQETLARDGLLSVPKKKGLILVARDAGAFELIVDGLPVGPAGESGEVLRGLPLDAAQLRLRIADPAETVAP